MINLRWTLAAIVLLTLAAASPALAEVIVGEEPIAPVGSRIPTSLLADRIPSVSGRAFTKAGRVDLSPGLGLTLSDPFARHLPIGAQAHFYPLEQLSVGLVAGYMVGVETSIDIAQATAGAINDLNQPKAHLQAQVTWLPIYGKISWLAESVSHFDTYIGVAGGYVLMKQGSGSASVGLVIGQHYVINPYMALRLEMRNDWFNMVRAPSVQSKAVLQNLLTAAVGVSFYLPSDVKARNSDRR